MLGCRPDVCMGVTDQAAVTWGSWTVRLSKVNPFEPFPSFRIGELQFVSYLRYTVDILCVGQQLTMLVVPYV